MSVYWCEYAWLPDGIARGVRLVVDGDRIAKVETGAHPGLSADTATPGLSPDEPRGCPPQPGDVPRPGLTLPGFADAHSHAFHRALRGRTQTSGTGDDTFWTWRRVMYAVAARLTPDSYFELARAAFAEQVLAGFTLVGEFHYVHHRPDGRPYPDPNAMGEAVIAGAAEAGIRLTLLDTLYLAGGLEPSGHQPLDPVQRRFADGSVAAWCARRAGLADGPLVRIGAAVHSVRAVPADALAEVAALLDPATPLHVHLSEQPAENAAALAHYGWTPTGLLAAAGLLGRADAPPSAAAPPAEPSRPPRSPIGRALPLGGERAAVRGANSANRTPLTAVHATHLTAEDVRALGTAGAFACFCPTTERDLADGIGPAGALHQAGVRLCVGSDSQAVVDPFEELRALEGHERLATGRRARFSPSDLMGIGTADGYAALGWREGGRLRAGAPADFVTVRLDTARTAGSLPEQVLFAATAADVAAVVVGGREVVRDGRHRLGDVGALLALAIGSLT